MRNALPARLLRALLAVALCAPVTLAAPPQAASAVGYDVRAAVLNSTIAQLGKPYIYGAAGPNSFDCSGLVQYAYNAAGIYVPHQSGIIWSRCDPVPLDQLAPGDLVFRTNLADPSKPPTKASDIRHVGIYVGGGQVIHAPSSGQTVSYQDVERFHCGGRLKQTYWPQSDNSYDQPPLVRGDFTGDGRDDACFFYGLGGSSSQAHVLPSSGSTLGPSAIWYVNTRWDWNRTKTAAADVDRDGKTDLLALYDYGGDTVKLWAFISDGDSFHPVVWWQSEPGGWSWSRTRMLAGDFTGDGRGDVALVRDDSASVTRAFVLRSTGAAFVAPRLWWTSAGTPWDARATKFAAGDLTGDGKADIATLYDRGRATSKLWVLEAHRGRFEADRAPWYDSGLRGWDWSRTKMTTADVNGDRKGDVVLLYDLGGSTSQLWAFVSSGGGFSSRHVYWTSGAGKFDWERTKLGAGDFDHEGRNDVTLLYDLGGGASKAWLLDSVGSGTANGATSGWVSPAKGLDWNRVR